MKHSHGRTEGLELLTAAEMQRWDEGAIAERGVPGSVLMESAGRAAARVLHELYPDGRVVGAVGGGKNGGDAVVLLRSLLSWGREVAAFPVGGDGLPAELLHGWEIPTLAGVDPGEAFRSAGVLVDGILGTGARGAPRDRQAVAIRALNGAGAPIVALDGPSGVDLTTGAVAGDAVRAQVTVTFGAPKRGLVIFPGREHAGRIVAVEIGLPPLAADGASARLITPDWAFARLPRRSANAHKGGSGTIAIVAGHPGMGGAAILVAMGALRAGAGKVRTVSPEANRIPLQIVVPEGLFVDRDGEGVEEVVESADAVVVGPGMGTDDQAREVLRMTLRCASGPILVDADALTLISRDPDLLENAPTDRMVMTPHAGEMGRLAGMESREIVADPFGAAEAAAVRFGCVILLKGTPSLVAAGSHPTLVNVAGHSGIATSGMGDTLAGVIAALLGMKAEPREAAGIGLFLAGRAAELAGLGRSILPRDVAEALPAVFADQSPFGFLTWPDVRLDLPAAR